MLARQNRAHALATRRKVVPNAVRMCSLHSVRLISGRNDMLCEAISAILREPGQILPRQKIE